MTAIGSIQTIPGSGGRLGEVIAMNGLASASKAGASNGGSSAAAFMERQMAAISLVPLDTPANKSASSSPTKGLGAAPATNSVRGSAPDQAATPALPASRPAAPISAASVTVIQQVDPRSLPGSGGSTVEINLPGSTKNKDASTNAKTSASPDGAPHTLSSGAQDHVRRLQDRDAAVRAEENSHKALAGANAGMISYDYSVGPDGRLYATGGHVSIMPLQGLDGIQAIANQAAIGRAASVGTSTADFAAHKGASGNISHILSQQQQAASRSYNQTTAMMFSQQQPKSAGLVA
ncbi:putative metalloprotease CJM1_0395 family protein [Thalassospira sp. TSL5-1]|uniref:putative metalloprotease CJM1_0395 family protein n=1 Tax=Thalassospira sp. TSL5-1 TaxID=1544451 RepID=UPI0009F9B628|nr:putative metalloprotease CJM1_0395 family protein [Thalassospira sp. TSL5-1]